MLRICVYGASSCALDEAYMKAARQLGEAIAGAGYPLVFGGGTVGLMGAAARGAHARGGKVIGVIPEALNLPGIVYEHCDELIITETMRERKRIMEDLSEAFVALPGGFGTLEELLEIITLKQLRYHQKPIIILNTMDFYGPLLMQFERTIRQKFAKEQSLRLFDMAETVEDAMQAIQGYEPEPAVLKWFTDVG